MPCRTVRHAVKISNDGDHIYIDYAEGKPYEECEGATESSGSIELSKSISFHGFEGKAEIRCKRDQTLFEIRSSTSYMVDVKFFNMIISNSDTVIKLGDETRTQLEFQNTFVRNNQIGIYSSNSNDCSVKVFNSSFEQNFFGAMHLYCFNITTKIASSTFKSSPVLLVNKRSNPEVFQRQTIKVICYKTIFDGDNIPTCKADMFYVKPFAIVINITIIDSQFRNHFGVSCLSKEVSSLKLYDQKCAHRKKTFIFFRGLIFENNYNNGPAINLYVIIKKHTSLHVEMRDSILRNNSKALAVTTRYCGNFRGHLPPPILFTNNTFVKNFFDSSDIRYAAAIYFASGRMQVSSCRFLDNKSGANPYIAAVTVSTEARVTFVDCYFENKQTTTMSNQLFASGRFNAIIFRGKNTFNLIALKQQQSIFTRTSSNWNNALIIAKNFNVFCPQGYRLISRRQCHNNDENIIGCYYMFLECELCPRKMYSCKRGEFSFNKSNDIQCHQCPRGGECDHESGLVTAKPNFWGYKRNNKVMFVQCPPGYCCDTVEHCVTYHSCYGNRSGTLCGQCPAKMSESLFSTNCFPNEDCSFNYFFIIGALAVLYLYLMFFLYQREFVCCLQRSRLWKSIPFLTKNRHEQQKTVESNGIIKILFYYYQICYFLKSSVPASKDEHFIHHIENVISRVMNMILVNLPSFSCPLKDLRAVPKALIVHAVGYCLLGLLCFLCLTGKLFQIIRSVKNNEETRSQESIATITTTITTTESRNYASKSTIFQRIVSAFTYISLLMYASSTKLCLSLLHCAPVGDSRVLFLDGNITCYQTFQYFLLAYLVLSILPFCLVPVLGSYLLKFGRIGVKQFCAACICPLPFCCFWFYLLFKERCLVNTGEYNRIEENDSASEQGNNEPQSLSSEETVSTFAESNKSVCKKSDAAAILSVLLGPFRCHEAFMCLPSSQIPWEGFLIFRRLVLITVMTFVYDIQLRLFLALTLCVAILVVHMFVNPFQRKRDNVLESFSLGTHVILCCLILIQGFYYGEDDYSTSNSLSLINLIAYILIVAPLSIVMIVVIFSIIIKLAFSLKLGVSVLLMQRRRIEDV